MENQFLQLLQAMSPEQRAGHTGMGTLDERGALLQDQIAQAQALRKGRDYKTGGQATMGNIGSILGAVGEFAGQQAQSGLLDKKDAGRSEYMNLLAQSLRGGQPQSPQPGLPQDASALAAPAQPQPAPGNAGMGDVSGGQLAPQKGRGLAEAGPQLQRALLAFGLA